MLLDDVFVNERSTASSYTGKEQRKLSTFCCAIGLYVSVGRSNFKMSSQIASFKWNISAATLSCCVHRESFCINVVQWFKKN